MRRPFLFLVAAAVPLLLYARTASFGFVHADDADLIVGNHAFLSDLRHAPRAFLRSYFEVEGDLARQKTYYRPVAIISFMVDAMRGGADPAAFHVTNVVLHAVATCLLLALALARGAPGWAAFAAALVFAVHPVNVQAVAWVAGRNDLLMAVFGVASLLAWNAGRWAAPLHVAAIALAVFSKETGVFFPLLAVLHQKVVCRRPLARWQWLLLAVDGVVATAWLVLRSQAGAASDVSSDSLRVAVSNLAQLVVHAGKILLPVRLNVSPGVDAPALLAGVSAVAAGAWAVRCWMDRRTAIATGAWLAAFLLPTLIVPGLPAYEHRVYVPLIGLLAGLAVTGRDARVKPRHAVALAAIAGTFAAIAYQRQNVFRDPIAYWTDATRDAAFGPVAHVNLGQLHDAAGRHREARREYLRALERDPDTPKAHNNLGVTLMALHEPDLAGRHFVEETRRHPWNADAWFNLGLWNEMRGDADEARRHYQRALAANPRYAPAREKLGNLTPPADRDP